MRLLVTGAHGLLGRALLETDWGADVERLGCGRSAEAVGGVPCHAVDITDGDAVRALIAELRPDRVIHAAAMTNVDGCETDPALARRVNLGSVAHVVAACDAIGAGVAHLSTDYVFDGRDGPYAEDDPTHPLSHYGRIKLESEAVVLGARVPGIVVRTLWLYGHHAGSRPNLVTWPLAALARGEALQIVDDQWGNPTHVGDLAQALVELGRGGAAGCFHVGGATFLTRHELVLRIAGHFGLDASGVTTMSTAEAHQAAARPLRSGLRTDAVEAVLGWKPATLEEGLARLAASAPFRDDFGPVLAGGERDPVAERLSISLVTPTYNECENVALLAEEIFGVLADCDDIDLELIVVDDNSPDGTGAAAEALTERYPVRVVHRAGKLGLGSAVMEGWRHSDRPLIGVIDADLSHPPSLLPELIRGLHEHDLTMGSRFGATSQVERWALHRKLISVVGVALARWITGAEDPLSGYFCLRREVIDDGFELTSKGYKILLEVLVKGRYRAHASFPFVFRNRQFSASKLNAREHLLFARQILVFGWRRLTGRRPGT